MVNSIPKGVNSIIFDLGGVLIDLAPMETAKAFATKAGISAEEVYQQYAAHAQFNAYEKGEIGDKAFRDFIRKTFSPASGDDEIDACWNAMLLGFPQEKQWMLKNLKMKFKTIVLSNTNAIHIRYIEDVMLQGRLLDPFFHDAYYSHQVSMRKPETRIYQYVLENSRLIPTETVFLDDNLENLEAAGTLGIHTIHITNPDQVLDLFKNL